MVDAAKFRRKSRLIAEENPWQAYVAATMARDPADRPWATAHEITESEFQRKKSQLKALDAMSKSMR